MATSYRALLGLLVAATVVVAIPFGIEDPNLVLQAPQLARPAVGASVVDPVFGGRIRRLTDATDRGAWATHVYSQLQAFSPDGRYVLLIEDGEYVVRRLSDRARLSLVTSPWNAPRWLPSAPHQIVHFDSNADTTVVVQYTDVETGVTTDQYTFGAPFDRVLTNQSFDELSRDGRWMAGMLVRSDDAGVIFTLDLVQGSLAVALPIPTLYAGPCMPDPTWGEVEPDWVGVSPLGRYLVVQWPRDGDDRCSGLETFDIRTGAFVGRVTDGHQHGDLGVMPDGTSEFFMTFEFHPSGYPSVGLRALPGAPSVPPPTYLQVLDWGNSDHISCQGPDGVCLVTAGGDPSNGWTAFEAELFLQYTDGRIRRVAHHRSTSCGYWVQPRASLSRDGRFAIFASDWGNAACGGGGLGRGEAFLVELGAEAPPPPAGPSRGRRLDAIARTTRPDRQRLRIVFRDPTVSLGRGDGSLDDPTVHGAALRVRAGTGQFDRTFPLPASRWRRLEAQGRTIGYRYEDSDRLSGPIRRITVRDGRDVKIRGTGAGLGLSLSAEPSDVEATLSLGAATSCYRTTGMPRYDSRGRFRAHLERC